MGNTSDFGVSAATEPVEVQSNAYLDLPRLTSAYLGLPRLTSASLGNTLGNTLGVEYAMVKSFKAFFYFLIFHNLFRVRG